MADEEREALPVSHSRDGKLGREGRRHRGIPVDRSSPSTPMTAPPSQGLWTCAVEISATNVSLAHKDTTTVCPPPLLDPLVGSARIADSDLETTAGCYSAGAQIDGRAVILYVPKRGRVLIN